MVSIKNVVEMIRNFMNWGRIFATGAFFLSAYIINKNMYEKQISLVLYLKQIYNNHRIMLFLKSGRASKSFIFTGLKIPRLFTGEWRDGNEKKYSYIAIILIVLIFSACQKKKAKFNSSTKTSNTTESTNSIPGEIKSLLALGTEGGHILCFRKYFILYGKA